METDQNLQAMPIIMPMVPMCGLKFPTPQRLWVPWSLHAVRPMDYNSLESPPSPVQLAQCHPTLHYDSPLCRAVWISFLSAGVDRPLLVYVLKAKTWLYPILTSTHRQHCSLAIYCEYHPLTEGRPAYPFMEASISFDHSAWQFPEFPGGSIRERYRIQDAAIENPEVSQMGLSENRVYPNEIAI